MSGESKDIFILGGPNGAGKTTAARVLLPEFIVEHEFLNADEIARQISPHDPEAAAMRAGRELLLRMRSLIRRGESFALETTCAGKAYLPIFERCQSADWRVTLLYFWLPSPALAIQRVAQRVSNGGHNIPHEVIDRRYQTGLWNMRNLYLPMANEAEIYDNSINPRILIAEKRDSAAFTIHDRSRWQKIEELTR